MSGYGGFYRAVVVSTADPQQRGRVKLRIPAVFGTTATGWADPLWESLVPREGSRVWAAFEAGDRDHPLYLGPRAVSFYPATVAAADGASVRVTVPTMFGTETSEWIQPLQDGPHPEVGGTVWLAAQAVGDPTLSPGKGQLVYLNPRVPVPTGGSPDLTLAYAGPFALEWIPQNDHLHDGSSPQAYSPLGHSH